MANGKVLVFEAPWSEDIDDTQATRVIYTSAETRLGIGDDPVRVIQRPLIASRYLADIQNFLKLKCNQKGLNLIVFSGHGAYESIRSPNRTGKRHRRIIEAFDGEINISTGIRKVRGTLGRTIIVLDSCDIGKSPKSFCTASGAAGVIGFSGDAEWVNSTTFILAMLLKFHIGGVMRTRSVSRPRKVLEEMTSGAWKSLAESLGVSSYFGP